MKKILSVNKTTTTTALALLIARTGIAALMLTHGIPRQSECEGDLFTYK